ncbi:MAG TPA: hypothetical protein VKR58_02960 [Aquella sp.]|nr:hypothetical protein [Aquella sp.]
MNFFIHHQIIVSVISFWIFSSFIGALPTPGPKSPIYYVFLFNFMHLLAANILRIAPLRNFIAQYYAIDGAPKKDN